MFRILINLIKRKRNAKYFRIHMCIRIYSCIHRMVMRVICIIYGMRASERMSKCVTFPMQEIFRMYGPLYCIAYICVYDVSSLLLLHSHMHILTYIFSFSHVTLKKKHIQIEAHHLSVTMTMLSRAQQTFDNEKFSLLFQIF